MQDFPHIVVARRDHDFRAVEVSPEIAGQTELLAEARWLALDWWGSCFLSRFRGALGHVRSVTAAGTYFLMLVHPGPVAPDRFILVLHEDDYRRIGYDPFAVAEAGAFRFILDFYRARGEKPQQPVAWHGVIQSHAGESLPQENRRRVRRALRRLARGQSIIVPLQDDDTGFRDELVRFLGLLGSPVLGRVNLFTFTNTTADKLEHFGPVITGYYDSLRTETLRAVLDQIVDPNEQESHLAGLPPLTTDEEGGLQS